MPEAGESAAAAARMEAKKNARTERSWRRGPTAGAESAAFAAPSRAVLFPCLAGFSIIPDDRRSGLRRPKVVVAPWRPAVPGGPPGAPNEKGPRLRGARFRCLDRRRRPRGRPPDGRYSPAYRFLIAPQVVGLAGVDSSQGRVMVVVLGAVTDTSSIQYWVEQLSQVDGLL